MTWDERRLFGRQLAFDDVEVGPADTAGKNFEENVAGLELGRRYVCDVKRALRDRRRRFEDGGFHLETAYDGGQSFSGQFCPASISSKRLYLASLSD